MNYKDALTYLHSLERFGSKLGLERINFLLKKLGNPHKNLKSIHVAGTNGKGSVCAMLSSILQESGYKVGMYTSPYLIDVKETIIYNTEQIPEKEFANILEKIIQFVEETSEKLEHPTYFEVLTAIAFEYFSRKNVDFAILEVGLGGRLDATNVVVPEISAITNISREHTEVLGDSIEEIAKEKAGIVKERVPVVTAANGGALNIIKEICNTKSSKLFQVTNPYTGELGLRGDFQKFNAAVAIKTIQLINSVPGNAIIKGLKKVEWQGRMDFRDNILFDCAHNPAAIDALAKELKKLDYEKLILVFGVLKGKDCKTMLKTITPFADKIIFTKPKTKRALNPDVLAKITEGTVKENLREALNYAKSLADKEDIILVTGSTYTVGEALSHLTPR